MDRELDIFIDSGGMEWIMSWGYCSCTVYPVAWQPRREYAGKCGRCNDGVLFVSPYANKESVVNRFRTEYDREPRGA